MARQVGAGRDPITAIELQGRIMVVRTLGGRTEVPAPVDYVVWTEPVKAFTEKNRNGGNRRKVLITGLASERSRQGLHDTGWEYQEMTSPNRI